jgi:hypothetical protein
MTSEEHAEMLLKTKERDNLFLKTKAESGDLVKKDIDVALSLIQPFIGRDTMTINQLKNHLISLKKYL